MTKAPGPIVLTVALALLILGAAALAYLFPSIPDLTGVTSLAPTGKASKKIKVEDLDAGIEPWNKPVLWEEPASHHRFLNPIDILFYPSAFPAGDYIRKLDESARLPGGMLIKWCRDNGLDFTSATIDRDDPDGDGFSNVAEFKNEPVGERLQAANCDGTKSTKPMDGQSHPDYLSRLRLKEYERKPFHITFNSYSKLNGEYLFQIRLTDLDSSKQPPLKKTGDKLGFLDYVIGEFHLNIVKEKNASTGIVEEIDRSTLDLIKPDIGKTIPLPIHSSTDSPESSADFVMLMPADADKVLKVSVGKILVVPNLKGDEAKFRVMDVQDDGAKIRNLKTNQDYHILKLIPTDWDDMPVTVPKNP